MNQPELGQKINDLRNNKGITQKELSEACNVDIRTIQRIESGEVIPRMSTLKLIAATLDVDFNSFNGDNGAVQKATPNNISLPILLLFTFFSGLVYLLNFIFYMGLIPGISLQFYLHSYFTISIIHVIAGVLFYYGFYEFSRHLNNKTLRIALLVTIIFIPLYVVVTLIANNSGFQPAKYLVMLVVILIGINGFIMAAGFIQTKSRFSLLYKIGGVLQFIISPMIITQIGIIQRIGLYITVLFILIQITIIYLEYRESKFIVQYGEA